MAKYTTQIRTIVESGIDIFNDYPIFDEKYREVLNQKIIDHYYFREIGLETVGQFKWFLKDKMNRIMPYYNQLYGSEHLITKDDYMINLNTKERHVKTIDNTTEGESDAISVGNSSSSSEGSSHSEGTGKSVYSDTPQGKLAGLDYATNLTETDDSSDSSTTGSAEQKDSSTSNLTNKATAKTTEEYITEMSGGGGMRYNADILMEWRKSFLNIDQQIIDELQDLFMNIY